MRRKGVENMDTNIVKTTDYNQFKLVKGNRNLNDSNLKMIMRSVLEMNLLAQNPIQVNENMEIIDGQHRLEVAKRLQVPIYYIVVDGGSLKDVIRLNAHRKSWSSDDYTNSYIKLGNNNYQILKDFMKQYKMRYIVTLSLLSGRYIYESGSGKKGSVMDVFRKGNFKPVNLKEAEEIANNLRVLANYCDDDCWKERAFVSSFQHTLVSVPFQELVRQFDKSKIRFIHKKNTRSYLREFEEVVNHGKREAIRLY